MADALDPLLKDFTGNGPSTDGTIECIEKHLGSNLPEFYRNFMRGCNGGEGFIGEQYLILWRAEELLEFNREYEVSIYAPELFLFGSNGGGEAFAFDNRDTGMKICAVPFVGMSLKDAKHVADTFDSFLVRLAESDETLW